MLHLCLVYEVRSSLCSGRYISAFSSKTFIILLFTISALVTVEFICVCCEVRVEVLFLVCFCFKTPN